MVNLLKLSFVFFSISLINAITINQVPDYVNNTGNLTDRNNTSIEYLNNSTDIFEKDHLEENLSSHRKLLVMKKFTRKQVTKLSTVNKPTVTISITKPATVTKLKSEQHIDDNHVYRHSNKYTKQTAKQTIDNFRADRSKNLSPAVKNVLSGNEKKLDIWLSTDLGKDAVKFCMSLGILNHQLI